MSANVGSTDEMEVNLTPLLDVVLQLIMFFMITVNFVRVESFSDQINLPVAQSGAILDSGAEDFVFLNLDSTGKLVGTLTNFALDTPGKIESFLRRERENIERESRLKGKQRDPKIVIVLRADADCRYRDIWQVVDSCQRAGFRRWQLRVMKGGKAAAA